MRYRWALLCGLPVLAATQVDAAELKGPLQLGKTFYRQLDFERCVQTLTAAERTLVAPEDLVERELYLGLCEASLNHTREASLHFQTALELDPSVALPDNSSPKVISLFQLAKARVRPAPAPAKPVEPAPSPPPVESAVATLAPAAPAPGVGVERSHTGRVPRWLPWTLGAVAVAGAATFGTFGFLARANADRANALDTFTDDSARLGSIARSQAVIANVGLGIGLAALGGLVLALLMGRADAVEAR